jgi:Zn-dependent protease with chaperone function
MEPAHPVSWQRVAIALSALAVYGAGASWMVHRAGSSYRTSLARENAVGTAPSLIAHAAKSAVDPPKATRRPLVNESPLPVATIPKPLPAALASSSVSTPTAEPLAAKSAELSMPSPVVDPIWNDPRVTKQWDVDHLTMAQEKELGESLKMLILTLNAQSTSDAKLVGDKTSADRVFEIAQRLLEKMPRKRKEVSYDFIVLDSLEPNAFSIPGGTIFVTDGLLLSIGDDEPHVLEFVLAHEIAHVDEQHALECLHFDKLWDLRKKIGTVELLYSYVLPNAYFESQEFAADRLAATGMGMMGHGRYEKLAYLRKLQRYADAHGFGRGHEVPKPTAEHSLLDNHVRAHVSAAIRLKKVKEWIDAKPGDGTSKR